MTDETRFALTELGAISIGNPRCECGELAIIQEDRYVGEGRWVSRSFCSYCYRVRNNG